MTSVIYKLHLLMSPNGYTTVFTLASIPFLPTHKALSVCTVRNRQQLLQKNAKCIVGQPQNVY